MEGVVPPFDNRSSVNLSPTMITTSRSLARVSFRRGFSVVKETPPLPGLAVQQLVQIETKDRLLREKHLQLESSLSPADRDTVRRKRMIYRSKQRGWLEVDLLLGSFAAIHVPKMTDAELDEFEVLLEEETIDVFGFVTGRQPVPPHLSSNSVLDRLRAHTGTNAIRSPETYAEAKDRANLI